MDAFSMDCNQWESPVVVYNSGGIGDQLLALPALRALVQLFPSRLRVVCVPGAASLFFSHMNIARAIEYPTYSTWDGRIGGIGINPDRMPTTEVERSTSPFPINEANRCLWQTWTPWTFDSATLAAHLRYCDVLLSLTPWHSQAIDMLCTVLRPRLSIGYSSSLMYDVRASTDKHLSEMFFDLPNSISPSLSITDFVGLSIVHDDHKRQAQRMLSALPSGHKLLVFHGDTKPNKELPIQSASFVIDEFLSHRDDFLCIVIGSHPMRLESLRNRERVFTLFPLRLATAMAVVEKADLFLGVDSCMLHVADLNLRPGVGVFGPTDSTLYGFRFSKHELCRGSNMHSIPPPEILKCLCRVSDGLSSG